MDVKHRAKGIVDEGQHSSICQDACAKATQGMEANVEPYDVMAGSHQRPQQFAVAAPQLQDAPVQPRRQVRNGALPPPRRLMITVEPVPWVRRPLHGVSTAGTLISRVCVELGMARRRNKGEERNLAKRRVQALFDSARAEALGPDRDLADRHAALARRVATRYQLPLRPDQKVLVCRKCGVLRRAETSRVRFGRGRLRTTCLACGDIRRRILETP